MIKLLVVGAGQIGSRHLQSLANIKESAVVYVYEPNLSNLEVAKSRIEEVTKANNLSDRRVSFSFISRLDGYHETIDVLIIATGSTVRFNVLKCLLEDSDFTFKHVILEKFLFNQFDQYFETRKLARRYNVKIYCNQWLSGTYPVRRIKGLLGDYTTLNLEVTGYRWGLACNSVHFVDLFDYLLDRASPLRFDKSNFSQSGPAKRAGFLEVYGELIITSQCNSVLRLASDYEGIEDGLLHFKITTDNDREVHATLNSENLFCVQVQGEDMLEDYEFYLPMQSQMTSDVVQSIILSDGCELPGYETALGHHLLVFGPLSEYFASIGHDLSEGLRVT